METMPTVTKTRRLVIVALKNGGFRVQTEWQNGLGYWTILSTTITKTFPLIIVGRVADRSDYSIFVRPQEAR